MRSVTQTRGQLSISAVIPCRNERASIESCLRSLLAQEPVPGGFEIIVADGRSDDGTRNVLKRLAGDDARVRVVDNPGCTTPCGMNAGIAEARGRFIAIMGAHNRYAPDYLCRSLEVLEETKADNVGGAMICEASGYWQRAIAAAHHSAFSVGGARWHDPDYEGPADTVFGGVYRREVFDRIGLFDEALVRNQDDELNLRLVRSGGRIWQSPRIRSYYTPRASLHALFRQYLQYGYWKVRVIRKHRLPASIRHLVPAGFVLACALLPTAAFWWAPAVWATGLMAAAYTLAAILASVSSAARAGWSLFPALPPVFASYHIGYGVGFLLGIVDFGILRRAPRQVLTSLTRSSSCGAGD